MPTNRISPDIIPAAYAPQPRPTVLRTSLFTRLTARLRADRLDLLLAVGTPAPDGSRLAVHAARLTTPQERETIARSLRRALDAARHGSPPPSSRVPVHPANVVAAESLIDAVTLRLLSQRPVHARGMARLRRVLSDGAGPMYRSGGGDLAGRLGAALAEL